MKPFSNDLRVRIVDVYAEGKLSYPQVAARFQVSVSSVRRFVKRWREVGAVLPKPAAHRHPKVDATGMAVLEAFLRAHVDASQEELCAHLQRTTGVVVSQPTMCRLLHQAGLTRKKRRNGRKNRVGNSSRRNDRRFKRR
jgi:transposase